MKNQAKDSQACRRLVIYSRTGCKGERCYACATTERFIPDGMIKLLSLPWFFR